MSVPRVVGLDLSSTRVGMCLHDGGTDHFVAEGPLLKRACDIRDWIATECNQADLVVIEAIGTHQVQVAIAMAYVHCLVDLRLLKARVRVVKVSAQHVKMFATSKSNADKTQMVLAASKAGWESSSDSTDDEADAWWMWALGRHMLGEPVVPETGYRGDATRKARAA